MPETKAWERALSWRMSLPPCRRAIGVGLISCLFERRKMSCFFLFGANYYTDCIRSFVQYVHYIERRR